MIATFIPGTRPGRGAHHPVAERRRARRARMPAAAADTRSQATGSSAPAVVVGRGFINADGTDVPAARTNDDPKQGSAAASGSNRGSVRRYRHRCHQPHTFRMYITNCLPPAERWRHRLVNTPPGTYRARPHPVRLHRCGPRVPLRLQVHSAGPPQRPAAIARRTTPGDGRTDSC